MLSGTTYEDIVTYSAGILRGSASLRTALHHLVEVSFSIQSSSALKYYVVGEPFRGKSLASHGSHIEDATKTILQQEILTTVDLHDFE